LEDAAFFIRRTKKPVALVPDRTLN